MKTFEKQNQELTKFDNTANCNNINFSFCVNRALLLIKNREAQMIEEGYEWPIATETCRWRIEQQIINRPAGMGMLAAAIKYVESIEKQVEEFNGI